ncbi:putative polyketide synthase [Seiridium cardinale]|uniref:Polyketide synthase n=1 Tax=Seiridium cardinale TaxID=138064 RepID=A0ABR2Y3L0_9PEZI
MQARSNYDTAHTFLDSFVQYRHGEVLPAIVIVICFAAVQVTLSSRNQISMSDREDSIIWKQEQCMTIYRNIEQIIVVEGGSSSENLRRFVASLALALDKLELATTATFFAQEITEKAGAFLMKSENLVPITQLQHSKVSVR